MTKKEQKILDLKNQLAIEVKEYASNLTDGNKFIIHGYYVELSEIGFSIYDSGSIVSVIGNDNTLYKKFVSSKDELERRKQKCMSELDNINKQLEELDSHE